jgi:hypothetical protein
MRNCLIMGAGRSGTSMLSGILHSAGYYMGENFYPPRMSNPKGFFETAEVNGINERILENIDSISNNGALRSNTVFRPEYGKRWLLSLPVDEKVDFMDDEIESRIQMAISHLPFAYKDPRFSYTLPVWLEFLKKDTTFICMFRAPELTVQSIMRECREAKYLETFSITKDDAYSVWTNMYRHILEVHYEALQARNNFSFFHYNQVFDASAIPRLSRILDASLEHEFVDSGLRRSTEMPGETAPEQTRKVYSRLCELAGYDV